MSHSHTCKSTPRVALLGEKNRSLILTGLPMNTTCWMAVSNGSNNGSCFLYAGAARLGADRVQGTTQV